MHLVGVLCSLVLILAIVVMSNANHDHHDQHKSKVEADHSKAPKPSKKQLKLPISDSYIESSNHTFIFVGGSHFSGTSITERLLSSQPHASGIRVDLYSVNDTRGCHLITSYNQNKCKAPENEGGFLTREFTSFFRQANRFCSAKPFYEWGRCASVFHLTEHNVSQAEGGAEGIYKRLLKDWSLWWNMDRQFLIEKDIPNMVQSRFLQSIFGKDKSYFIFMLRHPLASCKYFECNISSQIEAWLMGNEVMSNDLPYLKNYLVIHQEAYYSNTSGTVESIRKFLGWPEINFSESNIFLERLRKMYMNKVLSSRKDNVKRQLYFHGDTKFAEDYNVTIQNTEENFVWSKIYPIVVKRHAANISHFESSLNKFCYTIKHLEPICDPIVWKRS